MTLFLLWAEITAAVVLVLASVFGFVWWIDKRDRIGR